MEEISCRSKARCVLYLQAVILGISLSLVVFLGFLLIEGKFPPRISSELNNGYGFVGKIHELWVVELPIPAYIFWIAYVCSCDFVTGVQFWVSIQKATITVTAPKKALSRAKIWRNVTFFNLESIIALVRYFPATNSLSPLSDICRLLFLFFYDAMVKYISCPLLMSSLLN